MSRLLSARARFILLTLLALLIPASASAQTSPLSALPTGPFYVRVSGPAYTGLLLNPHEPSIALFVGAPILRTEIEAQPEMRLKYTDYNRHTVKWFKYEGIDVGSRQVLVGFRYRYQKLEDKLWGGRFTVYDNAANVTAGIRFNVINRQVQGDVAVRHVEADWASGILGLAQDLIDVMAGSIGLLTKGQFLRFTDVLAAAAPMLANHALADQLKIRAPFEQFNRWNEAGFIYLDRIDYQPDGIWLVAKLDLTRLIEFLPQLKDGILAMKSLAN